MITLAIVIDKWCARYSSIKIRRINKNEDYVIVKKNIETYNLIKVKHR